MKVLVVDDEEEIRDSLEEFFLDEGFVVSSAADGADALALLNTEDPPGVVILDLLMPTVSGNEVYTRMQEDPRLSKVPVIVSTSDPSRAPSGVPIMRKPINLESLLRAVQRYCP